jgi:Phosphotransferase enzyme family
MDNFQINWAIKILTNNGYQLHTAIPEVIQNTPWSSVYRFKMNQGFVFLKIVPPALSLEPKIINILHTEFHANVPQIIAANHELYCFLMQDAGIKLHYYFKENFESDILTQAMQDYARLQIMTVDKVDLFLNMGVPDWRLAKLPKLYQDLIAHEKLLLEDGLSQDELVKLKNLEPKLVSICEKLSRYKIKETFGHADFHDKNILINTPTKQTTLIDLGEVVITHPFFSFHNCLHRAKENFTLSDSQYQQLNLTCFKPWLALETQAHLLEILALIQQCWSIHAVLGELRLMNSVDPAAFQELHRQGRLAKNLRHWINQSL